MNSCVYIELSLGLSFRRKKSNQHHYEGTETEMTLKKCPTYELEFVLFFKDKN